MAQASKTSSSTLEIPTARVFHPLLKPSRYKGVYGGRGSAKSHFFADLTIEHCVAYPGLRVVCIREIQRTLKESVKLLIEDKIRAFNLSNQFDTKSDRINTPGNGMVLFQGMQDHTADSIKSLEGFDIAYIEQAEMLTNRSIELLRPTIRSSSRLPTSEIWAAWNPRDASDPIDALLRGPNPPRGSIVVRTNWRENPWFPAELEEERRYDEEHSPQRYAHIWEGEYEPMAVGAIWSIEGFNQHRRSTETVPEFKRIVVSIDPAGSAEQEASETGIVVCALGEDSRGYVLDDLSVKGMPQEWAQRAIAGYDLYEADAVVAETNYGGDLVANTIHVLRPNIRVIEVRASRGKRAPRTSTSARSHYAKTVRAEPISALYSLGKISHVGAFPKLEAQMCLVTAGGYEGKDSPDRVDALVWGFTELFPKLIRRSQPRDKRPPARANSFYNPHRRGVRR